DGAGDDARRSPSRLTVRPQSPRSAVAGSTCDARHAGPAPATSATSASVAAASAIVAGSWADRPYSKASTNRSVGTVAAQPAAMPTATSTSVSRSTSHRTLPSDAPSASRTPISFVRRATEYDTIAYNPRHAT